MQLHEEIMESLKARADLDDEYINPYFLRKITEAIYSYYQLEDDEVDQWVLEMIER